MNGQVIKKLRKRKGVAQREVAIETGLTENTLYEIEKGNQVNPTLATMEKIAKYYEIPVAELLSEK